MPRPASHSKDAPDGTAPGRRGRPTAARAAAIDSAIKAAALDLFVELGFEAASMDAIAAAAKVSKGTLYARYESKEPLFRAILEEQLDEWSRRASALSRPHEQSVEAQLRHYARTMTTVSNWPEFRRIAALLDTSAKAFPDLAREWEDLITKRALGSLTRDMAKVGGSGVDWEFYAKLFHSAITGWHRAETSHRTVHNEEIIAFADKVIEVMLASIGNSQAASASETPDLVRAPVRE
jgi:TetR/AcrR family transcriptional regulator, mexJK operon transcriptional repressor